MRGNVKTRVIRVNASMGTTASTQMLITARAHGFSWLALGSFHRVGQSDDSVGQMRG